MIKTKSVHESREDVDGLRILVSSYYPKQAELGFFDLWFPELGSPLELVKNWNGQNYIWDTFSERYKLQLQQTELQSLLETIKKVARNKSVTLIGHSKDGMKCHRSLLAAYLREY